MAQVPTRQIRISGGILLAMGIFLIGMGVWLTYIALSWQFPSWVPNDITMTPHGPALPIAALRDAPIGLAALYVLSFGALAGLNGLWNLWFGRRNWVFVVPMLLLFLVGLVVGGWATVQNQ